MATDTSQASELSFYALAAVLRVGMRLQSDIEALLGKRGLSFGQYTILMLLLESGERPLIASEIARRSGRSKPTVTKLLDKLEAGGLVNPRRDEADRRKTGYILAAEGRALLADINPDYGPRMLAYLENVSDREKLYLIGILNKLSFEGGDVPRTEPNALPYAEKSALLKDLCAGGSAYDVDCALAFLNDEVDVATTKIVDFRLGAVTNPEGIERLAYHLLFGTQIQRNYCTLFFARRNDWKLVNEAYRLGLVDYRQAYSR